MGETFAKALDLLFGTTTQPTPQPTPTPAPSPSPGATATPRPSGATPSPTPAASQTIADLVRSASQHYDAAQAALKAGDFAEYGRQIQLLQDDLARLRAATGQ